MTQKRRRATREGSPSIVGPRSGTPNQVTLARTWPSLSQRVASDLDPGRG